MILTLANIGKSEKGKPQPFHQPRFKRVILERTKKLMEN